MVPAAWSPGLWGRWLGRRHGAVASDGPDGPGHWQKSGHFRRVVLLGLTLAQTYIATSFMVAVLPYHGRQWLELGMICLFAILFAWVSGGFWTAMAGYALLLARGDRHAISRTAGPGAPLDHEARAAV